MILIHDILLASTIPAQQTLIGCLVSKSQHLTTETILETHSTQQTDLQTTHANTFEMNSSIFKPCFIPFYSCFVLFSHVLPESQPPWIILSCSIVSSTFSYLGDLVSRQPSAQRMAASPPWPWQFQCSGNGEIKERFWMDKQNPNRSLK